MPALPNDLICLSEAAGLLPCTRPGKKVHVVTLYRKIHTGKLHGYREGNGPWMVSRAEILGLVRVRNDVLPEIASKARREREITAAQAELREAWG